MTNSGINNFEPQHFGNDWGIFIDIENTNYSVKYPSNRHRYINKHNTKITDIESLNSSINNGCSYTEIYVYLINFGVTSFAISILTYIVYFAI